MKFIRKIGSAVVLVLLMAFSINAQVRSTEKAAADLRKNVINEDRGQAFLITTPEQAPLSDLKARQSSLPKQISIFLGDEWYGDPLRSLQPALSNLFESAGAASELDAAGFKTPASYNPFAQMPYSDVQGIADLQVQEQIRTAFAEKAIGPADNTVIVVVFIAPSIHSRLAEQESGKHFLAYKNTLNISSIRMRYVVVPLDANPRNADVVARKAFLTALTN